MKALSLRPFRVHRMQEQPIAFRATWVSWKGGLPNNAACSEDLSPTFSKKCTIVCTKLIAGLDSKHVRKPCVPTATTYLNFRIHTSTDKGL
jgi:putative SOS response-associated peptidase YedK